MRNNDYFLEFGFNPFGEPYGSVTKRVEHAAIPAGYMLFLYKEVYIPVREDRTSNPGAHDTVHYLPWYRGSGSNPATMDVPIHYVANPGGLSRALDFLKESASHPPSQAELASERARNLRVHIPPNGDRVAENESAERR